MNTTRIRNYSLALASVFALTTIGCNSSNPIGNENPGGPTNPVAPPQSGNFATVSHPVVNYNFFEIKETTTELDLIGDKHINYGYMIAKTKPNFNSAKFEKLGLKVLSRIDLGGAEYYHLEKNENMLASLKSVKNLNGVLFAEPEILHYTTDYTPWDGKFTAPDPLLSQLYGITYTHTAAAWAEHGFGPHKAVVANVDTGCNYLHDDLKNVVRHAYTWYSDGTALLPNGNPVADIDPEDWLVTRPTQANGTDGASSRHGTHTVGTMAAQGNNGLGGAGMCWGVEMVSYKGMNNSGSGGAWPVYGSIWHLSKWKKNNDYPYTIPVNMSLGSLWGSQFAVDMIEHGLQHNIIVVASSGNSYAGASSFPGSFHGTIRVGASDHRDRRAEFSQYGDDMSVVAPGQNIQSVNGSNNTGYQGMSGTSMASPHVAGLVGYMLTFNPDLKPDQIKTYIENNADKVGGATGFHKEYGHGRINTLRTIAAIKADLAANRTPASNYVNTPVKVKVSIKNSSVDAPLNGANVYLYQCNAAGTIQNYVASSFTGISYAAWDRNPATEPEDGVAYFSLLKPGFYKAAASFSFIDIDNGGANVVGATTALFEVKQGATVAPQAISFQEEVLFIQTLPTSNAERSNGDTQLALYDAVTGPAIVEHDFDDYDTLVCLVPKTVGTYWIRVWPYSTYYGEYALNLSTKGMLQWPAPGTVADPGTNGVLGGQTSTRTAESQLIEIDGSLAYADMTDATGHFYRFVVE